ncbi:unknown [Clostridium sp. CAG:448]|nr:unknown [Clostridium sp. CAG:448]
MGQAACAADTAADARHSFDKVGVQLVARFLHQGKLACFDAVAGTGLEQEVDSLFLEGFRNRVGQTAAAGKNTSEVGGIVQNALFHRGDVQIPAVKERLQFLEGQRRIHIRLDALLLHLHLLGGTRPDEDHLAVSLVLLDVLGNGCHRGQVMRNEGFELGEILVDIVHKRRAAGAGQKAFFGKLTRFRLRDHIGAQRRFDHGVEAQCAQARHHLPQLCIGKLAGDGRRHHRIDLVILIAVAALQHINDIQNEGFVHNGTERALVNAGAAGNALAVVDARLLFVAHGNGAHFAGGFARTLVVPDCAVGANLGTGTAFLTLGLIDMRHMVLIKHDGAEFTHVLATVRQASAAGVCHFIPADRAFVAGNIDDLNHIRVVLVAAHCDLHTLGKNCAFLIDAAPHGRRLAGDDGLGNVNGGFRQAICPCLSGNLPQNLVFQVLYLGIKLSHFVLLSPISSEITDFDAFSHFFQAGGKLLHQIHFDIEIDRQIRILMRRVDRASDKEIDVGCLFKQQPADQTYPVVPDAPLPRRARSSISRKAGSPRWRPWHTPPLY